MSFAAPTNAPPIDQRTAPGHFTFQVLRSFAEVRRIAPGLAQATADQEVFLTLDWFDNLLAHGIAADTRPYLLLGTRGDGAQALLPLVDGAALAGLSTYYSSLYGATPSAPGHGAEFLRAACAHIRNARPRWPRINLQPLAGGGAFATQAGAALAAAGYWTDTYWCFGNWYLEVAGRSYAQYHDSLPPKLRHNIERGRRRLARAGGETIRIIEQPGAELENGLREYAAIYACSWKEPEPFPDFIGGLCRVAAVRGWLRLGVVTLAGQPVAAQLWIVKDGTASIYKLAYDESFSRYSPGSVLTAYMMAHCIDRDRVRLVDYLTGDDAYKRDWMSHRRERIGLIAFDRRTIAGLAAGSWHFAKKSLRGLLRPGAAR